MPSGKLALIAVALLLGALIGATTSPLIAQVIEIEPKPFADDRSDWSLFVGNNDKFDNTVWIVRYNRVTGETWYKNGKKFVVMEQPSGR